VFRRCISLLVLAGFFANQLAVVLHAPHDHGAMTAEAQREHDATPHFHWRGNGERYHHHHAHRHVHRHPDRDVKRPSKSLSEKESDPLRRGQIRDENDSPPTGQTPFRIGSKTAKIAAWEQGYCPPAHDFDAVYGARWSFVLASGANSRLPLTCYGIGSAPLPLTPEHDWPHLVAFFLWHPPDIVLDGSHRYLTFRHLRI
jgi:hypothetical protein